MLSGRQEAASLQSAGRSGMADPALHRTQLCVSDSPGSVLQGVYPVYVGLAVREDGR